MAFSVLIVSADSLVGESLQIAFERDGRCQPLFVTHGAEALSVAQALSFALAILDYNLSDIALADLARALSSSPLNLPLIAVLPDNAPVDPGPEDFSFQGYLSRNFEVSDLMRMVEVVLNLKEKRSERTAADFAANDPLWLRDVNRAAQYLTRLSLESAAHAALIVRGDRLWAYAGQLPQLAATQLADQVIKYHGVGDLARFIHLPATDRDYMLYATGLLGDFTLALAFDTTTPFTEIRSQAASLAKALSTPPQDTLFSSVDDAPPQAPVPVPSVEKPPEDGADLPQLDLGDVPPPNPGRAKYTRKAKPSVQSLDIVEEAPLSDAPPLELVPSFGIESRPTASLPDVKAPLSAVDLAAQPLEEMDTRPTAVSAVSSTDAFSGVPLEAAQGLSSPTMPRFDPPTPTLVSLSFACVLTPRLPQHRLVGEVADYLPDIVRQICLIFGWRLEHIAVRPDYLQWVVSAPPVTSPSYLMRISRQQTSQRLFTVLPALARENPGGDFWAPGYLIISSHQPPPPQAVKEFIRNARRYQGLSE